ncbi:STM4504/CBY_0614 family protein [Rhodobium gokarnense]|uniref:Abortive infection protein-like C-terminal domain-containing protein n=1 Tax=Rhodobium gokarnense TaxID=364296 RepID=A0ABT3HAE2_9HYPH|nr:hypothetical protein [Rhodobium gokarnense]MCW2307363.1 hypothetical protein [Rhodobium gokarnense]
MPIFETFKKRMRRQRGDIFDVFQYETAPDSLRNQIVQIMFSVVGGQEEYWINYGQDGGVKEAYKIIVETLRRERGVFRLPPTRQHQNEDFSVELANYILSEPDIEEFLSAVELLCRVIENVVGDFNYRRFQDSKEKSAEAIKEINHRFREHGLGFEYDGELIRVDSELVHSETVKPALTLLRNGRFSGAEEEFLGAYDDYKNGKYEDALTDALKALESVLKEILARRGWSHDPNRDSFSKLLNVAFDNHLVPGFWQSHFAALRSTLEAGVPTARNRLGGHGQGTATREIPPHLVGYVLHMTASAIVFLVKSDETLP